MNLIKKLDNNKLVFLLIAISYIFSIAIRLIWVFQANGVDSYIWNDQIMLNTNDGYFFAYGALQEFLGIDSLNPRMQYIYNNGLVFTTFIFSKILPFSFETVILYMPAFISGLIVIPIVLIGKLFNNLTWGFASALLVSITWSFYNRTMIGYYDTDMFSIMILIFIFYFALKTTIKFNLKNILYLSLVTTIYPFFYPSGEIIASVMLICYIGYISYFFHKNKLFYKSLILIILAITPTFMNEFYGYLINIGVILTIFIILLKVELNKKIIYGILFTVFIIFVATNSIFNSIIGSVNSYFLHKESLITFQFFNVGSTIREASAIPFSILANRISGSEASFLLAGVGYFLLIFKHRAFLISIPLVIIGLIAYKFGLRFTIYALPFAGLSVVFLLIYVGNKFIENIYLKIIFVSIGTISLLYPNIKHVIGYKVPTTFNKQEVKDLDNLKKISSNKDYVITWWDYGYPIHFYSGLSTLIDGGKHNHDNYIASSILLSTSQNKVANFSRLAIETYVNNDFNTSIDSILKKYNYEDFLIDIKYKDFKLPKKTRDVFIYMPYKMINILSTVDLFSNINLITGDKIKSRTIFHSQVLLNRYGNFYLKDKVILQSNTGKSNLGNIKQIDYVSINNKITTKNFYENEDGLYAIFIQKLNYMIILDEDLYNSAYIQMLFLNQYDKNLFELIVNSKSSKIFKVKK